MVDRRITNYVSRPGPRRTRTGLPMPLFCDAATSRRQRKKTPRTGISTGGACPHAMHDAARRRVLGWSTRPHETGCSPGLAHRRRAWRVPRVSMPLLCRNTESRSNDSEHTMAGRRRLDCYAMHCIWLYFRGNLAMALQQLSERFRWIGRGRKRKARSGQRSASPGFRLRCRRAR